MHVYCTSISSYEQVRAANPTFCNKFDQFVARQQLCKQRPTRNNRWGCVFYVVRTEQHWNNGVMQPTSRQRLGKHISAYRTVLWKRWRHQQYRLCFPWGLCRVHIREVNAKASSVQGSYESVLSRRSEESKRDFVSFEDPRWLKKKWQEDFIVISEVVVSVLRPVVRRWVVKTENLSACATVNWKVCKSAIALYLSVIKSKHPN
jgi:hypothetical protein